MLIQVGEQTQWGQSVSIPPPIGGINTRDPLDAMAVTDAIDLENFFPNQASVELRRGYDSYGTGMGAGAVESLLPHSNDSGTNTLLACANSNIYNISASGAATSLKSGLTNNRWQGVQFKDVLILCNGADQPQQWDGSSLTDATYTVVADDSVFINVTNYRQRVYFVEKVSTSIWYTGVGAITGAVTEFDVGDLLRFGGNIVSAVAWSADTGNSYDERLVIITSEGEGLVFAGSYPGDSYWSLVARFKLPAPLGNRCFLEYGPDVLYLCRGGIYPLSRTILYGKEANTFERLTDKVQREFSYYAELNGSNFGWGMTHYPDRKMLLVNIPTSEGAQSTQLVMNTETGAWSRFTMLNSASWTIYNDKPYFGGVDGTAYHFDVGNDDNGSNIEGTVRQAFTYMGDRTRVKKFTMLRSVVRATNDVEFDAGVDVDLAQESFNNSVEVVGSGGTAWGSAWGSTWSPSQKLKQPIFSVTGVGRAASIKYQLSARALELSLYGSHLHYVSGGVL